jgi:hypothetical protein
MSEQQPIDIYLNDHLAGGTAAINMAEELQRETAEGPLKDFADKLIEEIKQDHSTLMDMMAKLGIETSPVKQVGAKVAELASRLKLGGGSDETGRLLTLEALSLGIEGKACLWLSLQQVAEEYGALASLDLGELLKRAESQRKDVERERLTAAAEVLSVHTTVPS